MRFIINFIFYGLLFYFIHLAFPEAFVTLVSWADKLIELLKEVYFQLAAQIHNWHGQITISHYL